MLRLLVLRHAKSDWNRPGTADFDRPLNARGKASAPLVGRYLKVNTLIPVKVLCSSALRARETLAAVMAASGGDAEVLYLDDLYEADRETLMDIVHRHGAKASPLLVVGHNPAVHDFVLALLSGDDDGVADDIEAKFPTAALAVIDADIDDWRDLAWRSTRIDAFIKPRELA